MYKIGKIQNNWKHPQWHNNASQIWPPVHSSGGMWSASVIISVFSCDNSSRSALVSMSVRSSVGPSVRYLLWFLDLKYAHCSLLMRAIVVQEREYDKCINTTLLPLSNEYVKLPFRNYVFESTPTIESDIN